MLKYFKNFIKHSTIYAIGNGINRAAGIVLVPLYTRVLAPSEYGALEMFYVTASVIRTFLGMMIAHATLRFYFEFDAEIDKKRIISTSLLFSIGVCLVAIAILNIYTDSLSMFIFKTLEYKRLFNLVFMIVLMELSREISLAYLRAREKSLFYVNIAVVQLVFQICLNLYMVLILKKGIEGILLGNLFSTFITWVILMAHMFNYCGLNFHLQKLKILLYYCVPFIFSAITGVIISNADRVVLNNFTSLAVVGVYALAMKFGLIIRELVIDPFTLNFGQSRFAIMKQPDARDIYSRIMTYYVFTIIFLSLGISLFAKEIVILVASAEFQSAYHIVPFVFLPLILNGMTYIFQTGMLIKKKTKYTFYTSAISAVLMIIMSRILVPKIGMYGAGLANVITAVCVCVMTWSYSRRLYPIKYEINRLLKIFFVSTVIYLLAVSFLAENIIARVLLFISFPLFLNLQGFFKEEEKRRCVQLGLKARKLIYGKLGFSV